MKTFRVILSVLAVVLAFGGAIASVKLPTQTTVYEFVDLTGTANDKCKALTVSPCDISGSTPCTATAGGPQLRQNNNLNDIAQPCGVDMWRN